MKDIKFSIVTILFNARETIQGTINSVLSQDYNNIEYIIVDGGSFDGSQDIILKNIPILKGKGIEVKYSSEKDEGISDAFNKGILKATGDVVGLINAGDGLLPDALNKLAFRWLDSDQIVYGQTVSVDKKNNLIYLREIPNNIDLSKMKYNGLVFTHQSAFVKLDVYKKFGLYNKSFKYIMDDELFLKFYQNGVTFRYVDIPLVTMQYGGISSHDSIGMIKEKINLSKKYDGKKPLWIWIDYIKHKPKEIIKDILRKNPRLWYTLIGKERQYYGPIE